MKKIIAIITIFVGLTSCIYPYDPDIKGTEDDILVLQGNIVAGGMSSVSLSWVRPLGEGRYIPQAMGTAWVEDDEGKVYGPTSREPSSGIQIPMDNASAERKYRMKAEVGENVYFSDWLEPMAPPEIEDVSFRMSMDSAMVEVTVTLNGGEQGTGYVGLTFDETWEFHADYHGQYYLDTLDWSISSQPYPNYWCWKSASSGLTLLSYKELTTNRLVSRVVHRFSRRNNRNHKLYSINVKAFTLSEDAYRYMDYLDYLGSTSGSLFSPNPGEMASNFRCENDPDKHVEGYVTASMADSFRAFMGTEFYIYTPPSSDNLFALEPEDSYKDMYDNGFYPVIFTSLPKGENGTYVEDLYWGPLRCIDCVIAGGTRQKPDFWP